MDETHNDCNVEHPPPAVDGIPGDGARYTEQSGKRSGSRGGKDEAEARRSLSMRQNLGRDGGDEAETGAGHTDEGGREDDDVGLRV